MGHGRIDLIGQKYGRLTVTSKAHTKRYAKSTVVHWNAKCECGKRTVVTTSQIRSGNTKSCGCLDKERRHFRWTTHGESRGGTSPEYNTWTSMRQRCSNPNCDDYERYGGRGIKVCARWENSVQNFIEDMGRRPQGTSLDRIDVNGPYSPENCRWATRKEQCRNKRNNVRFEYDGRLLCITEIAELNGLTSGELSQRVIGRKMPIPLAIEYSKWLRTVPNIRRKT